MYRIRFFLGGDVKFLALVCGIEAANADRACIWCKCLKDLRLDMTKEWSITDPAKGARTIEEITTMSELSKEIQIDITVAICHYFYLLQSKELS